MLRLIIEFIKKEVFLGRSIATKLVWLCSAVYVMLFFIKLTTGLFGFDNLYNKIIYALALSTDYHDLIKKPWSIFSYVLVNTNLWRLVWSLLTISYFSNLLVYLTDHKRLFKIYIVGILGGAAMVMLFHQFIPKFNWYVSGLVGMDSLCYALITANTVIAPNYLIGLLFIREVKLKYILFVTLITSLYLVDSGSYVGVAQVGGAFAAYVYVNGIYGTGKFFKKMKKLFPGKKKLFHKIENK